MGRCSHRMDANLPGLCAACEDRLHAEQHPELVDGCMACKLSSIEFGSGTGATDKHYAVRPRMAADPAWERGIAGEHRPGGGFMPILKDNGSPMGVKEAGERRQEIAKAKHRLANAPAPVA